MLQHTLSTAAKPSLEAAFSFMHKEIEEYLAWKGTYAPRAAIMYRIWLLRFASMNEKGLEMVEVQDVISYFQVISRKYSPYSVQYGMIVIKNFFKYWRLRGRNCLQPELIKVQKFHAKSHRAVTEEEYRRMLSVIPFDSLCHRMHTLVVRLLWETGMRVSELCNLDLSQIDLGKMKAIINTEKAFQKRIVLWSQETNDLLRTYAKERLKFTHSEALFLGFTPGDNPTKRLTPRSVERIVKQYAFKAGILDKVTPHSFRHGKAHTVRDRGAQITFVQKTLGHKNPISTMVYEQYSDQSWEEEARGYLGG